MSSRKFFVHPLAVFSIIEAWNNRESGSDNVLGALFGTKEVNPQTNEEYITIHEAYGIRHAVNTDADPIDVRWDIEALDEIVNVYTQVHANYRIVGWFTTYNDINRLHNIVHPFLSSKFDEPHLCMITVDVKLTNLTLSPKLYVLEPVIDLATSQTIMACFQQQELTTLLPPEERIALHSIMHGNNSGQNVLAPVAIQKAEGVFHSALTADFKEPTTALLGWLDAYTEKFHQGDTEQQPEIIAVGKQLTYILANMPLYDKQSLQEYLKNSSADLQFFKQLAEATVNLVVPPTANNI